MWFLLASPALAADPIVHHTLSVTLDPVGHRFGAVDTLDLSDLPSADGSYRFVLHAGLAPELGSRGWTLVPGDPAGGAVPLESWILRPGRKRAARKPVTLRFGGVIDHPPTQVATEYQRSFAETPGIIGTEGVFLSGAAAWIPTFGESLVTFALGVDGLAPPWDAISSGARTGGAGGAVTWRSPDPSEDVTLVAGPWTATTRTVPSARGTVEVRALLRTDDPALADRYLGATGGYLALYEALVGPYPYPSFALVENFWETGYGLPGFTLLGPEVVRFPFILGSSYPHELLHNWWGNSAYVDRSGGNWCEGLTSYLADHLFAEQRGEGVAHRRAALQKYGDFVAADTDFPLAAFGSRSSAASEAVGYGKAAMVFHMVRRRVGDDVFVRILHRFYADAQFRRASWGDFGAAVSAETGEDWTAWFAAWTGRTGAPSLSLVAADVVPAGDRFALTVTIRQTGDGEPFPLSVPIAVTAGGPARIEVLALDGREATGTWLFDAPPVRVDVDPQFDLMRRLDPLEVPPAMSTLLGSERVTFVLPSAASEDEIAAWIALATAWSGPRSPTFTRDDTPLPAGDVWVLGWTNRHAPDVVARLFDAGLALEPDRSLAMVAAGSDPTVTVGLVAADPPAAIPGLARKLPHYGRYATLVFTGPEPTNTTKGTVRAGASPLARGLGTGPLPPLVLAEPPPLAPVP